MNHIHLQQAETSWTEVQLEKLMVTSMFEKIGDCYSQRYFGIDGCLRYNVTSATLCHIDWKLLASTESLLCNAPHSLHIFNSHSTSSTPQPTRYYRKCDKRKLSQITKSLRIYATAKHRRRQRCATNWGEKQMNNIHSAPKIDPINVTCQI